MLCRPKPIKKENQHVRKDANRLECTLTENTQHGHTTAFPLNIRLQKSCLDLSVLNGLWAEQKDQAEMTGVSVLNSITTELGTVPGT